ncbi:MAG: hypothetical protein ACO31E_03600, partial [Phycisphaerales bacterium]
NADQALERLAQRLSESRRTLSVDDLESLDSYDGPTEAARRWLSEIAPFAAEARALSSSLGTRELDKSQGFRLVLPHLSGLRAVSNAMGFLASDAARRGDSTAMLAYLETQRELTMHTARDGLTISSLVAMVESRGVREALELAIDAGSLDRESAAKALEIARELGDGDNYGLADAMRAESDGMQLELGRLQDLPADERQDALSELLGSASDDAPPDAELASDESLALARTEATAYFRAAEDAMTNPDREAGREAMLALDEWAQADGRSPLLGLFAPALSRVHDRLVELEHSYADINTLLAQLADGSRTAADLTNAAPHYLAAAGVLAQLDVLSQQEIEAARLAGSELSLEDRMRARRLVDALRARVIDRVLKGAACGRCEFKPDEWPSLLPKGVIGANGAARLLLAEPTIPGERTKPYSRIDAVVAVLAMSRHYAIAGGSGRAMVSVELARDARRELASLVADGPLADADHARIESALARFDQADPFGFRAATAADRATLSTPNGRFDMKSLRGLSPNTVAFLVAIWTDWHAATNAERCDCPHDGPLVSIRGWFDPGALAAARAQRSVLIERAPGRPPLEGLTVTTPIDLDARAADGDAEFMRIRALLAPK